MATINLVEKSTRPLIQTSDLLVVSMLFGTNWAPGLVLHFLSQMFETKDLSVLYNSHLPPYHTSTHVLTH